MLLIDKKLLSGMEGCAPPPKKKRKDREKDMLKS